MLEWSGAESLASWGAVLRTGAAGSQDESPCRAIHKQRPYLMFSRRGADGHGMPCPYECNGWRSEDRRYEGRFARAAV